MQEQFYISNNRIRTIIKVAVILPLLFVLVISNSIVSDKHTVIGQILLICFDLGLIALIIWMLNRDISKIILNHNKLTIKGLFYTINQCTITKDTRIAIMSLKKGPTKPIIGAAPVTYGYRIGNGLIALADAASKNSTSGKHLILANKTNEIIKIRSNYYHQSKQLLQTLEKITQKKATPLHLNELNAWQSKQLSAYRQNPYPKYKAFLKRVTPYMRFKILVYPVLVLWLAIILISNISFNIIHKQFNQLARPITDSQNKRYTLKIKPPQKKHKYLVEADIISNKDNSILLKDIVVEKKTYRSRKTTSYTFYPYFYPQYLPRMVNLDQDEEAEILVKIKNKYQIYDYDSIQNTFQLKPVAEFSNIYARYITELKGFSELKWSGYLSETALIILFAYFFALGVFYFVFSEIRLKYQS